MKNHQEREFSRTVVRPKGGVHDCMDAGGSATQGVVVEGGTP